MNSLSVVVMPSFVPCFSALSMPMREIGIGIPTKPIFTGSFAASLIASIATGMS
jgi:hypothetical protein